MADRVLQRRDTAANWAAANPILMEGEIGIVTDGAKGYKIGDGATRWNALEYPANPTSVVQELGNSETAVISQKIVTEHLNSINEKLGMYYNGYINPASHFIHDDNSLTFVRSVIPGNEYIIFTNKNVVLKSKYYMFSSDVNGNVPIGSILLNSIGINKVEAPNGANYLFVCVDYLGNGNINDIGVAEGSIDNYLLESSINQASNIELIIPMVYPFTKLEATYSNSYFQYDSSKAEGRRDSSSFDAMLINVVPGDSYLLSATLGGNLMAMAIFYDSSGNNLGYVLRGDSLRHDNVNVKIPPLASEMIFTWSKSLEASIIKITELSYNIPDLIDTINKRIDSIDPNKNTIKVLLIGSSHGMNTIGQFPILAYNSGINVICSNAYRGSLTLEQLATYCTNGSVFSGSYKKFYDGIWHDMPLKTIKLMLEEEEWDFISIQRSASEDMTWDSSQQSNFEVILNYITDNCNYTPTIVFNSGFADSYSIATRALQQADSEAIWNTAQQVKALYGIEIIPMAPALQLCRNDDELANLGTYVNKMLSCDSLHLDLGIGMYVSGCICFNFFLSLFRKNILSCNYLPTVSDMIPFYYEESKFTAIDSNYARKIRKIVSLYFYGVS